MFPASLVKLIRTLVIGVAGGLLASWLRFPLPWFLGPLFACAAFNLAGAGLEISPRARRLGQWMVGTALGLYFTPEAGARIVALGLPLLAATVYSGLLGMGFSWALYRFGRADPATAIFGGSIGGATEMSLQGAQAGGLLSLMTAGHSLRVLIVVSVIPFSYQFLGVQGTDLSLQASRSVDAATLGWLLLLSYSAGWIAARVGVPNGWVLGPLFVVGATGFAGIDWSALPTPMINAGQILIGMSLGSRFAPGFFRSAPRYLGVMAVATVVGMILTVGFSWLLAVWSDIPFATMVLATAPGGVAEMSLTAKALQLGVPVVAVFHLVRYILLVLSMGPLYAWMARRYGWPLPQGRID